MYMYVDLQAYIMYLEEATCTCTLPGCCTVCASDETWYWIILC